MTAALSMMTMLAAAQEEAATRRRQAELAQAQAERERAVARQQADDYRRRQGAALATVRARRADSGVALAGSPLLADDAAEQDIALGEARILAGGADRATRLEERAAAVRRAGRTSALRHGVTLLRAPNGTSFWSP